MATGQRSEGSGGYTASTPARARSFRGAPAPAGCRGCPQGEPGGRAGGVHEARIHGVPRGIYRSLCEGKSAEQLEANRELAQGTGCRFSREAHTPERDRKSGVLGKRKEER